MLKPIVRNGGMFLAFCLCYGQAPDKALTFDAASVKPAALPAPDGSGRIIMAGPSGGPGSKDPGRVRYPFISLKNLLMEAYDVKGLQIQGPAWLDTERFDLNATMPPETTKEQFRAMLQNLLAERFKLTIHRETKEFPMYSLAVARNGPKMKESAPVPAAQDDSGAAPPPAMPAGPIAIGPDGFPALPAGRGRLFLMMLSGRARLVGQQQTALDLATRLTTILSRPVSDTTGLTAKYDFTLTFSTEGIAPTGPMGQGAGGVMVSVAPPAPSGGGGGGGGAAPASLPEADTPPPDIFKALKEQLGLTLEPKKGPVELIVIDHIEKTPTEN